MQSAYDDELISKNPALGVKLGSFSKKSKEVFLEANEIRNFINVRAKIKGYSHQTEKAVKATVTLTAMRLGELVRLDWEHIDFDGGKINIYNTKNTQRKGLPDGLDRFVPLTEKLESFLQEIRFDGCTGAVFRNSSGKRITRNSLLKIIKDSGENAGIEQKLTPNSLRHNLASWILRCGGVMTDVDFMLGHEPKTASEMYTNSNLREVTKIIRTMETRIFGEEKEQKTQLQSANCETVEEKPPETAGNINNNGKSKNNALMLAAFRAMMEAMQAMMAEE